MSQRKQRDWSGLRLMTVKSTRVFGSAEPPGRLFLSMEALSGDLCSSVYSVQEHSVTRAERGCSLKVYYMKYYHQNLGQAFKS